MQISRELICKILLSQRRKFAAFIITHRNRVVTLIAECNMVQLVTCQASMINDYEPAICGHILREHVYTKLTDRGFVGQTAYNNSFELR